MSAPTSRFAAALDRDMDHLRQTFGDYRDRGAKNRIEYVKAAADVIRARGEGGIFSTASHGAIEDVSDVIYLADYIERGPESWYIADHKESK